MSTHKKTLLVRLLVEIFPVGLEFRFAKDAAAPPGLYESCPISCKLDECGRDGKDSDMQAAVPQRRIAEDDETVEYRDHNRYATNRECCRKQMNQFECTRMPLLEIDSGYSGIMYLPEEFPEISAPFVPYPGFGEQAAFCSALKNPDAEINIFTEPHPAETAKLPVQILADSHIE